MTHQPLPDASSTRSSAPPGPRTPWTDAPVSETMLRAVYDLARMGPTAANSCPARFVFLTSEAGKQRLSPIPPRATAPRR